MCVCVGSPRRAVLVTDDRIRSGGLAVPDQHHDCVGSAHPCGELHNQVRMLATRRVIHVGVFQDLCAQQHLSTVHAKVSARDGESGAAVSVAARKAQPSIFKDAALPCRVVGMVCVPCAVGGGVAGKRGPETVGGGGRGRVNRDFTLTLQLPP